MATAGQYGSGYTAVPPTVAEQGHSAADVPDENRYAPQQATTGWGYHHGHRAGALNPTTGNAAEGQGQRQYQGAEGVYGPNYVQYDQAAAASNQTTQWNHQYYQNYANGVAVPQAVYYYYDSSVQYWNQHGVGQPMNELPPGSNLGQYTKQQYVQTTTQAYEPEGNWATPADSQNASPKPSTSTSYDGWQHRNALMDPVISESHPRQNLTVWKWRLMLIASNILSLINGRFSFVLIPQRR